MGLGMGRMGAAVWLAFGEGKTDCFGAARLAMTGGQKTVYRAKNLFRIGLKNWDFDVGLACFSDDCFGEFCRHGGRLGDLVAELSVSGH
jgi:hypothetical protein